MAATEPPPVEITLAEVAAMAMVAEEIVLDVFRPGWPDLTKNYTDHGRGASLPFICVRRRDRVVFDHSEVRARCMRPAIEIYLPFPAPKGPMNATALRGLIRTVLGALVHELAHARRFAGHPELFLAAARRQREYEGASDDRSPADWIRGYYGEAVEREAHVLQVAAELRCTGNGDDIADDPHGSWAVATEAGRRMRGRLLGAGEHDAAVEEWWRAFTVAVAEARDGWAAGDEPAAG